MKKRNLSKIILSLGFVSILSSCQIAYSHPITQAAAKEIISSTVAKIKEKDYNEFSKITFESKLTEEKTTSFFYSLYLEETFKFEYASDPYSLNISVTASNKEHKDTELTNANLVITKTNNTYMVSFNGTEAEDINQEQYKAYWNFCDFPTYIKTISQKLINKADSLINSVGNLTDSKENKLAGFQTSSSGSLNLDIEFTGSEFDAKDVFFQTNYNAETATELNMKMNDGLINKFSSKYAFVVNEATDYYHAGTYEGKIENTIKYE